MLYLTNTFTLGMLSNPNGVFKYQRISLEQARQLVQGSFVSAVGHQATAELMSNLLSINVPFNRIQIQVQQGDSILVCQILVRLEEGKILQLNEMMELYNQGKICFYIVEVVQ